MTYRQIQRLALCLAAAAALASPLVTPSRAQQPPQPTLTINQLDASAYPEIRAVVTALDARGVPAPGLTAREFQAFDGQAPVPVTAVTSAQDASLKLSVVLAIDISGSMQGDPLDRAKAAANDFVAGLGSNDEASVVAFNQAVTPVVPFTSDHKQLADGIATLKAVGGTALYESVQDATYAARLATSPRSAVVLLTDGVNEFTDSKATAEGSLDVAKGSGVPVFTIGFGAAPDTAYLQGLAASTQGQYYAANTANVATVYGAIATLLRNQYLLTLKASAPTGGQRADLRLVANIGGAPAVAAATFTRGAAPATIAPVATNAPPSSTATNSPAGSSGTDRGLIVASVVAMLAAVTAGYVVMTWRRRRRLLRDQLLFVAPNPLQAAAQGVPKPITSGPATSTRVRSARLIEKSSSGEPLVHTFGGEPLTIGSGRDCGVRLEPSPSVAPHHAVVWIKDGKIMLRHVGGPWRRTMVANRPVKWVILENGDEFTVGEQTFRAEQTEQ